MPIRSVNSNNVRLFLIRSRKGCDIEMAIFFLAIGSDYSEVFEEEKRRLCDK